MIKKKEECYALKHSEALSEVKIISRKLSPGKRSHALSDTQIRNSS